MRHLLSPKVAVCAALLFVFAVLPAAPARAEDGSAASFVADFWNGLMAAILGSGDEANAAPLISVSGEEADGAPLIIVGGEESEAAPLVIVSG